VNDKIKQLNALLLADLARSTLTIKEAKLMQLELVKGDELPFRIDGAYKIPYFGINGKVLPFARFRSLDPSPEAPKYQQEKDVAPLPYFEPVTKDWLKVMGDPKYEVNVVEGEKKAVAVALATKIPTIGLSGTHSWQSAKKHLAILIGLHAFDWMERRVNICFDASAQANAHTLHATYRLALLLKELGADVHIVFLPALFADGQTGPDDYLKAKGAKELSQLFSEAAAWLGWPLNDQGNAERFAFKHGENLRCIGKADSESSGRWLVWDDRLWLPDAELMRQRFAQTMPSDMRRDAMKRGADIKEVERIESLCSAARISSFVKLARSIPPIPARQEKFDAEGTVLVLNCQNGTLELPAIGDDPVVNLREPRREDMITRISPAAYRPEAPCPRWDRAMRDWTGKDEEMARTLQQLVGLSLTGVTTKHLFIIMLGDGQTGKTTFQEAILHILARYGGTIPSDHLVLQRNNATDERRAVKLVGLRFVSSSETKQGGTLDESFIKIITGGDTLSARELYAESFDFKPQAKVWLRTNYPLTIRGTDNGIWRRIVEIPFAQIIKSPDRSLPDRLREEADGILAWAVRGWLDYVKSGDLYLAPSVIKAKEDYQKDQDIIGVFIEEECDLDSRFSVTKRELYAKYKIWAEGTGKNVYVKNDREFGGELKTRKLGESRIRDKVTGLQHKTWVGIQIKPTGRTK
jgi:P4 family phage/plasmid primase-like protien